jgi:hypothetical protein
MRKLDRAGILALGEDGIEGLAALVQMPFHVVDVGMAWWLKRGTFDLGQGRLVMPNFLEAQEAVASGAKRSRESRERARDTRGVPEPKRVVTDTKSGDDDTMRVDSSRDATRRNAPTQSDTLCCAVLNRAVLNRAVPSEKARAPASVRANSNGSANVDASPDPPAGAAEGSTTHLADDFALTPERRAYAEIAGITTIDDVFKKFRQIAIEKLWRFDHRGWETRWQRFVDDECRYQRNERERARGRGSSVRRAAALSIQPAGSVRHWKPGKDDGQ